MMTTFKEENGVRLKALKISAPGGNTFLPFAFSFNMNCRMSGKYGFANSSCNNAFHEDSICTSLICDMLKKRMVAPCGSDQN
jgi:hypothetical protein